MFYKYWILTIIQLSGLAACHAQNNVPMKSDTSLYYQIRESNDSAVHRPMLILLHGYGSHEMDLFSFNSHVPENWTVVSLRAPYKLDENSYRWYDVKMLNGEITVNIEEAEVSRIKIIEAVKSIAQKYKADTNSIVIAGFSQGANMSELICLSEPDLIAGFGVFSGRYVEDFAPYISKSAGLKGKRAFVSHGSADHLLPKALADENVSKLNSLGIHTTFCGDVNGHSISEKQWAAFNMWLQRFR